MKRTLLIEIGVEELPASYLQPAVGQFAEGMEALFRSAHLAFAHLDRYFTPRRMTLIFRDIDERGRSTTRKVYGPPEKQAFDDSGRPTKAAVGFARSMEKDADDIKIGDRKGKRVCYIEKEEKPQDVRAIIKTSLEDVLSGIYFPKKMKWEETRFEFARPIRWLVLLLDRKTIRTHVAGVASSKYSFGPRFTGSKKIKIDDAAGYEQIMRRHHVMLSCEQRREKIRADARRLLESGLRICDDQVLVDEVANLVECPSVFKGSFDASFLTLPRDVLMTAMKEHQRYFAVLDEADGIKPIYVGVSNSLEKHIEEITEGHDSVLRARLSDARFYWDEDLKTPFAERLDELKRVEWHAGLGTVYDKTMRLVALSRFLQAQLGQGNKEIIERGALLSKVDLVTNMIKDGKEFTTLEGIIGKEYALRSNEKKDVAEIIAQHHLPRFPEDGLPALLEASIVGVADRIDTLAGNFLIGEVPSGSSDPFGLRRSANGLLRIIESSRLRFSLRKAVEEDMDLYASQKEISLSVERSDAAPRLFGFIDARLETHVSNMDVRYDIASAVTAVPHDDLFDAIRRIHCLNQEKDDAYFDALVIGQRRVSNILQGVKDAGFGVNAGLFDCDAERMLWSAFESAQGTFQREMERFGYRKALKALFSLRPHIDDFFDNCMVMDKDDEKRGNRIALLMNLRRLFNRYADFSLIVLEGEQLSGSNG